MVWDNEDATWAFPSPVQNVLEMEIAFSSGDEIEVVLSNRGIVSAKLGIKIFKSFQAEVFFRL